MPLLPKNQMLISMQDPILIQINMLFPKLCILTEIRPKATGNLNLYSGPESSIILGTCIDYAYEKEMMPSIKPKFGVNAGTFVMNSILSEPPYKAIKWFIAIDKKVMITTILMG